MDRRQFLKLFGISTVAATPLVYALAKLPQGAFAPQPRSKESHLIERLTFGVTPELYTRVSKIGTAAFIAQQLRPDALDDTWLEDYLQPFAEDLNTNGGVLFKKRADRKGLRQMLVGVNIARAVRSERQLYERMTQFWGNHFYIYFEKQHCAYYKIDDDRDVIRPYTLAKFRQLLGASAHSPAMLVFLDNAESTRNVPNENYAREMLELHTLGVEGGYTESDVKEVARCFTGWSIQRDPATGTTSYQFKARQHDDAAKIVLDTTISSGGELDGETVLDLVAAHPSTAHFVSRKIARRFVSDNPPAALVERLANTFQQSSGDIPALLDDLFAADEFWNAPPKLKQPFEYMVSVMRALNVELRPDKQVLNGLDGLLNTMGNVPFQWPAPNGYPDVAGVWQSSLLVRWKIAMMAINGKLARQNLNFEPILDLMEMEGVALQLDEMLHFMGKYLFGRLLTDVEYAITVDFARANADALPAQFKLGTALLLASPAFQYR